MIFRYRGMRVDALEAVVYLFAGLPRGLSLITWIQRRRLKLLAARRSPSDPDHRRFKSGFDDILTALFRTAALLTLAAGSTIGLGLSHTSAGKDAPEFTQFYLLLADVGQSALLWTTPVAASLWLGRFALRHFLIVGRNPTFATIMAIILLPGIALGVAAGGIERPLRLVGSLNEVDLFLRCNSQDRLARNKNSGYEVFEECREWIAKNDGQSDETVQTKKPLVNNTNAIEGTPAPSAGAKEAKGNSM